MKRNGHDIKMFIDNELEQKGVVILPPMEAKESMQLISALSFKPVMTMIDPWYNRGVGGVRQDYIPYIVEIIDEIKDNTDNLYLWGFPEIVALFVDKVKPPLEFVCWLTWFFKNCPSVIRGWRSSQQACLHFATPKARLYPENFFNEEQRERLSSKKMRFIPGPNSVIEEPLLVGFVGKNEQTGHKSQKPEKVYEKLLLMTSQGGDLVYDPMAGSGTLGAVSIKHNRKCILSDMSEEYVQIMEKRLDLIRIPHELILKTLSVTA